MILPIIGLPFKLRVASQANILYAQNSLHRNVGKHVNCVNLLCSVLYLVSINIWWKDKQWYPQTCISNFSVL